MAEPTLDEIIEAIDNATARLESSRERVSADTNGKITDAFSQEIEALYAAHDIVQWHKRALAVVEAARRERNCLAPRTERALAAFDAADTQEDGR